MDPLAPPQVEIPPGHLWVGQGRHVLLLVALLPAAVTALARHELGGSWLGIDAQAWWAWAVAIPVAHQVVVALGWRLQLRFRLLTRLFGRYDLVVWGALFLPLLVARPISLAGLAWCDRGSLGLSWGTAWTVAGLLAVPAAWALFSTMRWFGIPRALGGDHFRERYRAMPFVRRGAFAWTDNAMYGLAFLGLWAVALAANSWAALCVALFQHAYIWVHWWCTEEPDLRVLHPSS